MSRKKMQIYAKQGVLSCFVLFCFFVITFVSIILFVVEEDKYFIVLLHSKGLIETPKKYVIEFRKPTFERAY